MLNCSDGRIRCRVISTTPKRLMWQDLGPRPVAFDRVAEHRLHLLAVLRIAHVDEVADDQPAQIAEPELPGDLAGGLQVVLEGRLLGVLLPAEPPAVDVDGHQGLGLLDHDRAAALELHRAGLNLRDLLLDLILVKERDLLLVVARPWA